MTDSTAAAPTPTCSWFGDHTLRIAFGTANSPESLACVRTAFETLKGLKRPEIADLTPAYTTLLVHFQSQSLAAAACEDFEKLVTSALAAANHPCSQPIPRRVVDISVCYQGDCAPDLQTVAAHSGLSTDAVIALHSGTEYDVAFLGFSPGFPYLTGLPEKLATPRLEKPRVRVPAGSIGIAGDQTGIYPRATPGGWQLIGRTPLNLFDPIRSTPSLLSPGDRVRFLPIPRSEFDTLAAQSLSDRKT